MSALKRCIHCFSFASSLSRSMFYCLKSCIMFLFVFNRMECSACRAQCINSKEIQSRQYGYEYFEWATSKNTSCSIIQTEMHRRRMYWSNQLNVHDTRATDLNEASAWKWWCHEWIIDEFVCERATWLGIGDAPLHFGLQIDTLDINTCVYCESSPRRPLTCSPSVGPNAIN